jgi:hypothetical protein
MPLSGKRITYSVTIPGGLSKRVTGTVENSTTLLKSPPLEPIFPPVQLSQGRAKGMHGDSQ